MRISILFILVVIAFSFSGCDERRVYEKNLDLPSNDWYEDSICSFDFEIQDIKEKYNIDVTIRNAISYPFANLYVQYYLRDSSNKLLESKLLRLPLFDKKTGKPFGDGLGDIFDHKFSLLKDYTFNQGGRHRMEVKQYMRQDPLPFIVSVGVRVEKTSADGK